MMRKHLISRYRDIVRRAEDKGATWHLGEAGQPLLKWIVAPTCEAPVYREITGVETGDKHRDLAATQARVRSRSYTMELTLPCRQCQNCLRVKAAYWRRLIAKEMAHASRSWFCTFTFRAEYQFEATNKARARLARRSLIDFDALSPKQQFKERHAELSREVTLFLKRLRQATGAQLRYILVAEAHKSGLPHYHMILHEVAQRVKHKDISKQWRKGFSNVKLVADGEHSKAAYYVTKYLTKSMMARVRASQGYGSNTYRSQIQVSENERETSDPIRRTY